MDGILEAYVHGFAMRENDRFGAFAVAISLGDDTFESVYKLRGATTNQAELRAAQFAILSATIPSLVNEFRIHSTSHYLVNMFAKDERGGWLNNPSANKPLVEEVRKLTNTRNVVFLHEDGSSEKIKYVRNLARKASEV